MLLWRSGSRSDKMSSKYLPLPAASLGLCQSLCETSGSLRSPLVKTTFFLVGATSYFPTDLAKIQSLMFVCTYLEAEEECDAVDDVVDVDALGHLLRRQDVHHHERGVGAAHHALHRHLADTISTHKLQGDLSGCSLGVVDIKTKVVS